MLRSPSPAIHGFAILSTLFILLSGCVDNPTRPTDSGPPPDQAALELLAQFRYQEAAAVYLQLAENYKAPRKQDYQLRAADALVAAEDFVNARRIVETLSTKGLTAEHDGYRNIVLGSIAMAQNDPGAALSVLTNKEALVSDNTLLARYHLLRAQALEQTGQPVSAAHERANADPFLQGVEQQTNHRQLWGDLKQPNISELNHALGGSNVSLNGWIELSIIAKRFITDAVVFERAIADWTIRYEGHPGAATIVPELLTASLIDTTPPAHIALLLPRDGTFKRAATALRDGFLGAWFADASNPKRPRISIWNTHDKDIRSVYNEAVESGADFVVGPLDKLSVTELFQSSPLPVSTLALNHVQESPTAVVEATAEPGSEIADETVAETATTISGILYQYALSPEDEAKRVAERAWFEGYGNAALVAPEGNWGHRVSTAFTETWTELGGVVVDQQTYERNAPDMSPPISALLGIDQSRQRYRDLRQVVGLDLKHETRRRRDVDFVFMAAFPRQARLIRPQLTFHRAADLPVLATSHVYAGVANPAADIDIDGVWFGDMPWILVEGGVHGGLRTETETVWSTVFNRYTRLFAFGVDAYSIVPELGRLRAQSSMEFEGETGWLSVDENGQIHRRLQWANFVEGLAELLDAKEAQE